MKINGTKIKAPSEYSVSISDLDGETHRNAKGQMIRDRVAVKRKIECSWNMLTIEEMKTLLNAVKDEFFSCTYLDPMTGTEQTKTFYVGDRTSPIYSFVDGIEYWKSLKMNFVEK